MEELKGFTLMFLVALCGVSRIDAYPTGATNAECAQMMPGHGPAAQTSTAPFTVTTDSRYYVANEMRTSKSVIAIKWTSATTFIHYCVEKKNTSHAYAFAVVQIHAAKTMHGIV